MMDINEIDLASKKSGSAKKSRAARKFAASKLAQWREKPKWVHQLHAGNKRSYKGISRDKP